MDGKRWTDGAWCMAHVGAHGAVHGVPPREPPTFSHSLLELGAVEVHPARAHRAAYDHARHVSVEFGRVHGVRVRVRVLWYGENVRKIPGATLGATARRRGRGDQRIGPRARRRGAVPKFTPGPLAGGNGARPLTGCRVAVGTFARVGTLPEGKPGQRKPPLKVRRDASGGGAEASGGR